MDLKMKLLKFVDHWVGGIICNILSLIHRITHPFYRSELKLKLSRPPKIILVIKFFGLGSILLSSALLKGIKNKYPRAKIIFFTFKGNSYLVRQLKLADEVRIIDTTGPLAMLISIFNNLIYFSFHKPDISIDLEFFSKFSTMMSYLSGARWRIGFYTARFWRNSLVNVPVYFNYARHILEIYGMVGKSLGVEAANLSYPLIPVNAEDNLFIDKLLVDLHIQQGDFLMGVNVNASELAYNRRWPIERFSELINSLLREDKKIKIFLTGCANEFVYTASIYKFLDKDIKDRVFNLSGKISLLQFIALLGRLHLFLTNDSGPFHLAKGQGTPTVSIWGPGSPDLYGPYAEEKNKHKIIYTRYSCSPCLYIYRTNAGYFCGNTAPCLDQVGVPEAKLIVRQAIEELSKGVH